MSVKNYMNLVGDRELSKFRTQFIIDSGDDGYKLPNTFEEVIEEINYRITASYASSLKIIQEEQKRHKGDYITLIDMIGYSRKGWLLRDFYNYQYVGLLRKLGEEIIERFGVTELEATNIVMGYEDLFEDYANKYYRIKYAIPLCEEAWKIYEGIKEECRLRA